MGDMREAWDDYNEVQRERGAEELPPRRAEILALRQAGHQVLDLNDGYQYRVDNALDLFPVRQRFHHLRSGQRGRYRSAAAIVAQFASPRR